MSASLMQIAKRETVRLGRDESGVAVMFVLCMFLFLFALCTSVWFFGENVRRKAELQNACDAAAYSASVVQADGLSRMAVVNRAMAWSYIQMTKMQMDYITLRWLELTRERFERDRRNTEKTSSNPFEGILKMMGNLAGYWTLNDIWDKIPGHQLAETGIDLGFLVVKGGLNCRHDTHNEPNDSKGNGSYIGFRGMFGDGGNHIGCVRLNSPPRDIDGEQLYVPVSSQDATGGDMSIEGLLDDLHARYGEKGAILKPQILILKNSIITCNALLPLINRQMATAIEETAVKTLYENLPRTNDGQVDPKVLRDYHWMVSGGVSRPPAQYPVGFGATNAVSETTIAAAGSYFSGLRNTEEDEMLFLNMADGLPDIFGPNGQVRLVDYFSDPSTTPYKSAVAAGLDQWFIRCDPNESAISDQVVVNRDFKTVPSGIVRAYKNANYDEGSSGASLLQKGLAGFGSGIHRGNYVSEITDDLRNEVTTKVFNPVKNVLAVKGPSELIDPGKKPKKPRFGVSLSYLKKRAKWEAKTKMKEFLASTLDAPVKAILAPVVKLLGRANELTGRFITQVTSLDVEPSCINDRLRFVDQCANVRDTTGLVSEYEWASAYWFCHWISLHIHLIIINVDFEYCAHPFVPIAAMHGGRKGTDSYVDDWGSEMFCMPFQWIMPEIAMFRGDKGKTRVGDIDDNGYRSNFISIDTDMPEACNGAHKYQPVVGWTYNGLRSNYLMKSLVRIYGDDAAIYDECYQGVPSRPWVLNENFFKGAGTIVVGVARKQRNIFAEIMEDVASPSIYSAFTPADSRQHFVALAAGRAGYSPRTGSGTANGADSVNNPAWWRNFRKDPLRRYEVRYDAVLDKRLGVMGHPLLPEVEGLSSEDHRLLEQVGRIGCVCGTENTTKRLRRQWNLSQTDWDGVLLPLRHAHATHTAYDSFGEDPLGEPVLSQWNFSSLGGPDDSVASVVDNLLWHKAVWRPFVKTASSTDPELRPLETPKLMPLPSGLDKARPADLFRKRRIL